MMIGSPSPCSPPSLPSGKISSVPHVVLVVMHPNASFSKPDGAAAIHSNGGGLCPCCGRRHFIQSLTTAPLFRVRPSKASDLSSSDTSAMLSNVHPPRPQWYEELQAFFLNEGMKSYENEIAGYKAQLFSHLEGKAKEVLEIGMGTGPDIKYYAGNDMNVVGPDPKCTGSGSCSQHSH